MCLQGEANIDKTMEIKIFKPLNLNNNTNKEEDGIHELTLKFRI
jgi:hypothetical protein